MAKVGGAVPEFFNSNVRPILDPGGFFDTPGSNPYTEEDQQASRNFLQRLQQYQANYQQAQQGQNQVANYFRRVLAGQGPSLVRQQVNQGMDQVAQQQQSQVAGTSGVNAAIARRDAMANTANAQVDTNRAAAMARVAEMGEAAKMQAAIRANQANQAGQMFGANVQGASNFANTASGAESADLESQRGLAGNMFNAAGSATAMFAGGAGKTKSDERSKKDVAGISDSDMKAFLTKLAGAGGKTFEYKDDQVDETAPPGDRMGIMAQDVKGAGPVGKSMVVGDKPMELDNGNSIGAALAAIAYLAKKVKALEGRK